MRYSSQIFKDNLVTGHVSHLSSVWPQELKPGFFYSNSQSRLRIKDEAVLQGWSFGGWEYHYPHWNVGGASLCFSFKQEREGKEKQQPTSGLIRQFRALITGILWLLETVSLADLGFVSLYVNRIWTPSERETKTGKENQKRHIL